MLPATPGAAPGIPAATWPSAPRSSCTQPVLRAVFSKVDTLAVFMAWFLPVPLLGLDLADHLPAASAEAQALAKFENSIVTGELARLPRRQREVLSLTVDGYSPAEIAARLGIEANAVRVHLHHARAKVRARMAAAGGLAA